MTRCASAAGNRPSRPCTPSGSNCPRCILDNVGIRIEKVDLPGIGTRHDLITESGRRVGVVSHRNGERQLALFDQSDPDSCRDSIQCEWILVS